MLVNKSFKALGDTTLGNDTLEPGTVQVKGKLKAKDVETGERGRGAATGRADTAQAQSGYGAVVCQPQHLAPCMPPAESVHAPRPSAGSMSGMPGSADLAPCAYIKPCAPCPAAENMTVNNEIKTKTITSSTNVIGDCLLSGMHVHGAIGFAGSQRLAAAAAGGSAAEPVIPISSVRSTRGPHRQRREGADLRMRRCTHLSGSAYRVQSLCSAAWHTPHALAEVHGPWPWRPWRGCCARVQEDRLHLFFAPLTPLCYRSGASMEYRTGCPAAAVPTPNTKGCPSFFLSEACLMLVDQAATSFIRRNL